MCKISTLIIGLCNSSANCWLGTISLIIADVNARVTSPPEDFSSKHL